MGTTVYQNNDEDDPDKPGEGGDGGKKKGGNGKSDKEKTQEKYQKIIEGAATALGGLSVASDMTVNSTKAFQQIANQLSGTSYEIINLGERTLIRGITVDALGRRIAIVGIALRRRISPIMG
jgi:hypothetical protein